MWLTSLLLGALVLLPDVAATAFFSTDSTRVEGDTALIKLRADSENFDDAACTSAIENVTGGIAQVLSADATHIDFRVASDDVQSLSTVTLTSAQGSTFDYRIEYTPSLLDYSIESTLTAVPQEKVENRKLDLKVTVSFQQAPIWREQLRFTADLHQQNGLESEPSTIRTITHTLNSSESQSLGVEYNETNSTFGVLTYRFQLTEQTGCFRVAVSPVMSHGSTKGTVQHSYACHKPAGIGSEYAWALTDAIGSNLTVSYKCTYIQSPIRLRIRLMYNDNNATFTDSTYHNLPGCSNNGFANASMRFTPADIPYTEEHDWMGFSGSWYYTFDGSEGVRSEEAIIPYNTITYRRMPYRTPQLSQYKTLQFKQLEDTIWFWAWMVSARKMSPLSRSKMGIIGEYANYTVGEYTLRYRVNTGASINRSATYHKSELGPDGSKVRLTVFRWSPWLPGVVADRGDHSPPFITILPRPSKATDVVARFKAENPRILQVYFSAARNATGHKAVLVEGNKTTVHEVEAQPVVQEFACADSPCYVTDLYGHNKAYPIGTVLSDTDKVFFDVARGFAPGPGPHTVGMSHQESRIDYDVSAMYEINQDIVEYGGRIEVNNVVVLDTVESTGYSESSRVRFDFDEVVNAALTVDGAAAAMEARVLQLRVFGLGRSKWTNRTHEESALLNVWPVLPQVEMKLNASAQTVRVSYTDTSSASFRDDVVYVNDVGPIDAKNGVARNVFDVPMHFEIGECKNLTLRVDTAAGTLSAESEAIEVCNFDATLPTTTLTGHWVHPDEHASYVSPGVRLAWTPVDTADEYIVRVAKTTAPTRFYRTQGTSDVFFVSNASAVSVAIGKDESNSALSEVFVLDTESTRSAPVRKVQLLTPRLPIDLQSNVSDTNLTFRVTWELPSDYIAHWPVTGVELKSNDTVLTGDYSVSLDATSVDIDVAFSDVATVPAVWELSAQTLYFDTRNPACEERLKLRLTGPKQGHVSVHVEYMERTALSGLVVHYDQSVGDGVMSHLTNYETVLVSLENATGDVFLTKNVTLAEVDKEAEFSLPFSLLEMREVNATNQECRVSVYIENALDGTRAVSTVLETPRPPKTGPLVRGRLVYGGRGLFLNVTGADSNVALTEVSIEVDSRPSESTEVTQGNSAHFFVPLTADECVQGVNAAQTNVIFESPATAANLSVCAPSQPDGSRSNLVQLVLRLAGIELHAEGSSEWFDLRDALRDEIVDFLQSGADTQVRVVALEAYRGPLQLLEVSSAGVAVTVQIEGPGAPKAIDVFVATCVSTSRPSSDLLRQLACSANDNSMPLDTAPLALAETPRPVDRSDTSNWWIYVVIAAGVIAAAVFVYKYYLRESDFGFFSYSKERRFAERAALTELSMEDMEDMAPRFPRRDQTTVTLGLCHGE